MRKADQQQQNNRMEIAAHQPVVSAVTNEARNKAFAGTGSPTKELVWRVSLLNLASRSAENTDKRNAR